MDALTSLVSGLVAQFGLVPVLVAMVAAGLVLVVGTLALTRPAQSKGFHADVAFKQGYKGQRYVGAPSNEQDFRANVVRDTERRIIGRKH